MSAWVKSPNCGRLVDTEISQPHINTTQPLALDLGTMVDEDDKGPSPPQKGLN